MEEPRTNLLTMRSRFFGRVEEIERVEALFEAGARLVTIVGPAGVGKSRLARELATRALASYGALGGVYVCVLGRAGSAERLVDLLGAVLGVPVRSQGPELLAEVLSRRGATLLVLDNMDEIGPDGAALMRAWLERAPDLSVIATSRTALGIDGEAALGLGPLESGGDGAALLLDRVRERRPDFDAPASVRASLVLVAEELQGNALAIELVAARIAAEGLRAVVARIEQGRGALDGQSRRALERVVDVSWELLSDAGRRGLASLSVFPTSFDEAAAVAVIGADTPGAGAAVLRELLDRTLVHEAAGARYAIYVSVQGYAERKLAADPAAHAAAVERHARHYAAVASGTDDALAAAGTGARARLLAERDHVLTAIERGRDAETVLRAAAAAELFARAGGSIERVERALARARALPTDGALARRRAEVALVHARAATVVGRAGTAVTLAQDARRVAAELRDERLARRATAVLAMEALNRGDLVETARLGEEGLAAALAAGDRTSALRCATPLLFALPSLAEDARARAVHAEVMGLVDESSEGRQVARLALVEGRLALADGDFDTAERAFSRGAELSLAIADGADAALALAGSATIELLRGDHAGAIATAERAAAVAADVGYVPIALQARALAGIVEWTSGDPAAARARLSTAAAEFHRRGLSRNAEFLAAYLHAIDAELGQAGAAPSSGDDRDPARARVVEQLAHGAEVLAAPPPERLERARAAVAWLPSSAPELAIDRVIEVRVSTAAVRAAMSRVVDDVAVDRDAADTLVVSAGMSRFRLLGGERVDLSLRGVLLPLFRLLVDARVGRPGERLHRREILRAIWNDDAETPAALNRLRVSISTLRSVGLGATIVSEDGGYKLDPGVPVVVR